MLGDNDLSDILFDSVFLVLIGTIDKHDDIRVLFFVAEGRGDIIDDETEVSAYPAFKPTRAKLVEDEWNLATMEPKSGRYPGQTGPIQEHLSDRDKAMRTGN